MTDYAGMWWSLYAEPTSLTGMKIWAYKLLLQKILLSGLMKKLMGPETGPESEPCYLRATWQVRLHGIAYCCPNSPTLSSVIVALNIAKAGRKLQCSCLSVYLLWIIPEIRHPL